MHGNANSCKQFSLISTTFNAKEKINFWYMETKKIHLSISNTEEMISQIFTLQSSSYGGYMEAPLTNNQNSHWLMQAKLKKNTYLFIYQIKIMNAKIFEVQILYFLFTAQTQKYLFSLIF